MMTLDKIDKNILSLLQDNAHITIKEIAAAVNKKDCSQRVVDDNLLLNEAAAKSKL